MMDKNSQGVSASKDNTDAKIKIDKATLFKSSCLETLEDGKLVLSYAAAGEQEPIHTGKWTDEEMAYAEGLIDEFKAGNLALPDGTSLRQFLAKMLNCSPKRISKRYEGNNYSKGRKFYVKSSEKLDLAEAQRRRAKLQYLERRHKKKLLQLKIPHLLIADSEEDDPEEYEGDRKVPASLASREQQGGTSTSGLAGGSVLSGMPTGVAANEPSVASLQANQPMVASTVNESLLSNIANRSPGTNAQDLLTQFRSQQAVNRLLELQRGFNPDIGVGNLRLQQQMQMTRTSLLQRTSGTLEPSSSLSDPLSSLLSSAGRNQNTQDNSNLGLSYQLQMLLREEDARNVARQEPTVSAASAVRDLYRSTSNASSGSPLLSSLISSGPGTTANLSRATNAQVDSLIQLQLQVRQQSMSPTQRQSPPLGNATLRQEPKTNNEGGRAGEYVVHNRQTLDALMASVNSRTSSGATDQTNLFLSDPARLLASRSLSLSSTPSVRAPTSAFSQQSTADLVNFLSQSRASFSGGANQGMAMQGQKRNANEVDYSNNSSSGNSRRRLM